MTTNTTTIIHPLVDREIAVSDLLESRTSEAALADVPAMMTERIGMLIEMSEAGWTLATTTSWQASSMLTILDTFRWSRDEAPGWLSFTAHAEALATAQAGFVCAWNGDHSEPQQFMFSIELHRPVWCSCETPEPVLSCDWHYYAQGSRPGSDLLLCGICPEPFSESDYLSVECPSCGAAVGEFCHAWGDGNAVRSLEQTHATRISAVAQLFDTQLRSTDA